MRVRISYIIFSLFITVVNAQYNLVTQNINFTEIFGDIPNPDREFYRPQSYVVPIKSELMPHIPNLSATITGTSVSIEARIFYKKFELRKFSSNAPINGIPLGPWSSDDDVAPNYGATQPLTPTAINYIMAALQKVRENEAVAIVIFNYDGRGFTYNNRGGYENFIHDCEPKAPQGRMWLETGAADETDLCDILSHEDKNWVQYHLWQLRSIFREFEDCLMAVKGGFFSPWGEMPSSSYSKTKEDYHWLLEPLLKYVPDSRSILLHASGFIPWHNVEYGTNYNFSNLPPAPTRDNPAHRFGMFYDSYSRGGNEYTDGESLYEELPLIGGTYDRNNVLTWMRNQNNFYGDETVRFGNEPDYFYRLYPRFPNVPYEAAYAQTTHFNTSYSSAVYSLWDDFVYTKENITKPFTPSHDGITRTAIYTPEYEGRIGMGYMLDRQGYRLVLREANASERVQENGPLIFEGKVQNVCFSNVVNKKNMSVILKSKDSKNSYMTIDQP